MKILIIRGAPRKNGATNIFADTFVRGAKKYAEVEDVNLSEKDISMCKGCYACVSSKNAKCIIDDDMTALLNSFENCDAIVCFTPVYFYSMSAQLKSFFDRCFPIIATRKTPLGVSQKTSKKMISFSVASSRLWAFEAIAKNFEMIARELEMDLVANIKRPEAVYFSDLGEKSIRIKKILSATEKAGEEFAQTFTLSKDTIEALQLPIALSDEIFTKRSFAYWNGLKTRKNK